MHGDVCFLNNYISNTAARGMAMLPKRAMDIANCETVRLLKLTTDVVQPLHVIVPRKSAAFQDDIYPDCYAGQASMSCQEWMDGADLPPKLMSLKY